MQLLPAILNRPMAYAYDGSSGRLCIYHFALETGSREGDTVIEKDGINIFVDSDPQPHAAGLARDVIFARVSLQRFDARER